MSFEAAGSPAPVPGQASRRRRSQRQGVLSLILAGCLLAWARLVPGGMPAAFTAGGVPARAAHSGHYFLRGDLAQRRVIGPSQQPENSGLPYVLHCRRGSVGKLKSRRSGLIRDLMVQHDLQHPKEPQQAAVVAKNGLLESCLHRVTGWLDAGLGSALLLSSAAASIAMANFGPTRVRWLAFWARKAGPRIGAHALSLRSWVNEGLMSLFFFSVGLEVKKEMLEGALASPRKALLPCIAALGGMIIPVLVYLAINMNAGGIAAGACIPMATDIAFAIGVFHVFRGHMPAAAEPFLLALATVDDLGAIVVIALCFAGSLAPAYLAGALVALAVAALTGKKGVNSARQFLIPGVLLWYCLLRGGLNADIAGVLIAFCIPMRSLKGEDIFGRLSERWAAFSSLLILPIFALANCAVPLASAPADAAAASAQIAVPAGVSLGLMVGKPLGIFGFSFLAVRFGLASMPPGMTKLDLGIVGILGSIGFTMCLFLIEHSLVGAVAQKAKLAVFLASGLGGLLGAVLMARQPSRARSELAKA